MEARTGKMASPTLPAPIQEASQPQLDDDMISSGDDVACRTTTAARHVDESAGERKPASAKNPTLAPNMKATLASEPVGSASAASPAPRSSLSCADVAQGDEPSTDVGSQMVNIGKERASSRPPSLSCAQVSKQQGPFKPPSTFKDSHSHRSANETEKRKDDIPCPYSVQEPFPIQPELGTVISRQEQLASETAPGPHTPQSSRSTLVQTRGPQAAIDIDIMNPRIVKSSDSGDASGPGTVRFYHRGEPGYYMTNFFHSPMFLDGQMYATSEAYFHSRKFPDDRWLFQRIASAGSPRDVLDLATANKYIVRDDWFQVNVKEMFDAVMLKFICNSTLATQLLNTGDAYLIEAAPKDRFWGEGDDRTGRNELGHVLMKVRAALRNIHDLRKQAVDEADGRTRETSPLPAPAPPIARAPASASTPVPSSAAPAPAPAPAPALGARPRNTSKGSHLHRSAEGAEERKDDTVFPYQPHSDPKALHSHPEQATIISRLERLASEPGPGPSTPPSSKWTPAQTYGSRAEINIDIIDVVLASPSTATPTTSEPSTPEPRSRSSSPRSSTILSTPNMLLTTVGSTKRGF
ncbi:unnamed protein product [Tilletia caries]|uniref:NADAR domain-containing protein n=2 Tax=Tilletia TaxID=13289 RepID=A0ABN7IMP2_9BASI|nr:unnamed protein product [Tilletia caries]